MLNPAPDAATADALTAAEATWPTTTAGVAVLAGPLAWRRLPLVAAPAVWCCANVDAAEWYGSGIGGGRGIGAAGAVVSVAEACCAVVAGSKRLVLPAA